MNEQPSIGGDPDHPAAAAERERARQELLDLAERAAGSGIGLERPWGDTSESIAKWVHDLRQEDVERLDELDRLRSSLENDSAGTEEEGGNK